MHRNNKIYRISLFLVILTTLVGCQLLGDAKEELAICPTPTVEELQLNSPGQLFYFLVAGKKDYESYRKEISETIIPNTLSKSLSQNDTVILAWIEADGDGTLLNSIPFNGKVIPIDTPVKLDEGSLELIPVYTPDPSLIPGPKKDKIEAEITETVQNNQQLSSDYFCNTVVPLRLTEQESVEEWKENQNNEINKIVDGFQQALNTNTNYQVGLLEAIKLSESVIQSECSDDKKYSDCTVLMFSNIDNPNEIISSTVNYSYSNLAIIMLNCNFWIDQQGGPKCKSTRDAIYEALSSQSGAPKSICFFSKEDVNQTLAEYLRSKKCNN